MGCCGLVDVLLPLPDTRVAAGSHSLALNSQDTSIIQFSLGACVLGSVLWKCWLMSLRSSCFDFPMQHLAFCIAQHHFLIAWPTGCLPRSSALLGSCLTRTGCLMCSLALLCGLARADCLLRSSALLSSCLACAGCLLRGSVPLCIPVCTGSLHAAEVNRGMMCVGTRKLLREFLSTLCCDHPLPSLVSSGAKVGTGISHSAACGGDVGCPGPLWASPLSLSASQALPLHTLSHMCSGLSRILHMRGCRLIAFGLTCVGSDSAHGAYRALIGH
jgi:hypothetical protein